MIGPMIGSDEPDAGPLERLLVELDRTSTVSLASRTIELIEAIPGVSNVEVWLADFGYEHLTALDASRLTIDVSGTAEGEALRTEVPRADGGRLHLPLGRRGQVIGVLSADAEVSRVADLMPMSIAVCSALLASQGHSDLVPVLRGAGGLGLPATIQHQLLPLLNYSDEIVEIGGLIEPAYDIAGDAFDYAVNRDLVHMAVFDGVGHGLRASTIAMISVGAYRQSRRTARSLPELAAAVDQALAPALHRGEYVTGLLVQIDPARNRMSIWNAGHPSPILAHSGTSLALDNPPVHPPFGLGGKTRDDAVHHDLLPGDLLLLYSDGVVHARDVGGQFLGHQFLLESVAAGSTAAIPLRMLCRQMTNRVRSHVGGSLRDDATVLALRLAI